MCQKCEETKRVMQEWVDKQGHDRCWYYPELFRKLVALHGVEATKEPALPPEQEFEGGCKRFKEEEYRK